MVITKENTSVDVRQKTKIYSVSYGGFFFCKKKYLFLSIINIIDDVRHRKLVQI